MTKKDLIIAILIIIIFFTLYITYLYFYNKNKIKNERFIILKSIFLSKPLSYGIGIKISNYLYMFSTFIIIILNILIILNQLKIGTYISIINVFLNIWTMINVRITLNY